MKIEILRSNPILKGSLLAIVSIKIPEWCMIIDGVSLLQKGNAKWTAFPAKKGEDGKYWPYIRFDDHELKKSFDKELFRVYEKSDKKPIEINSHPEGAPDPRQLDFLEG
jgi:DNA-binding cell septation regulator SpoVG